MAQPNAPAAAITGSPKMIQISLLAKVLEQDNPVITTKMLPFLLQDGVAELIVNFIVRTDPSSLPASTGTPEEYEALKEKRANTAVILFEKASQTMQGFLEKRADDMAASLFKVLEYLDQPTPSQFKFDESVLGLWRRTVTAILTSSPALAIEGLTSDHSHMTAAVRVLGREDVAQAVLQIYSAATQPALSRKLTWFTWLLSKQLFSETSSAACGDVLISLILAYPESLKNMEFPGQTQTTQPVYAFLQPFQSTDFLDNLAKATGKGGQLGTLCVDILWRLAELETSWPARLCPQSPFLIQSLVQLESKNYLEAAATQNSNSNSNLSTSTTVTSTTTTTTNQNTPKKKKKNKNKGGQQSNKDESASSTTPATTEESTPSTPSSPSNDDSNTSDEVKETETTSETSAEKKVKKTTAHKPDPVEKMSVVRWGVARLLATLADVRVNGKLLTLDALAEDQNAWKILSSWFLRFPYANIYHQQFYTLVKASITNRHWASLRRALIDNKFLTTMTNHYHGPTRSGVKGFIFLICSNLMDMCNELKATPPAPGTPEPQRHLKGGHRRTSSVSQQDAVQAQQRFILYVETHEGWKKMVPLLSVEVKWISPPPERPAGMTGGEMMGLGGGGGFGPGGRRGFQYTGERDEVLLDMPTGRFRK